MGVGIELDTENSCRKYQICKPVAPRRNRNRSYSVAVFSYSFQSLTHMVLLCIQETASIFHVKVR